MNKKRIAVLGAGPTGLTAAWKLRQEGHDVILLERSSYVGGFGASFKRDGFILDYGPHTFHVKKGEVIPIVEYLLGDDLIRGKRNIRTLAKGKYLKYPFEFYNLISQLNPFFVIRMIFDFVMASIIYKFIHVADNNFESWGIKRFGKTLYNFCFGRYTEKVWGMPAHLISHKFAAKKIKGLDIKSIISKILGGKGEEQEIYWEDWLYPRKGSGQLFDKMNQDYLASGGQLSLESNVTRVNCEGSTVTSIDYVEKGKKKNLKVDEVISTIPLKNLILSMSPSFGDYISYTAKRLQFRGIVLVYVVMDTNAATDAHWIYLLDPIFKFNRVTEQKNLVKDVCPEGKTVLCFEMCCSTKDPIWQYTDEQFKDMIFEEIKNIKIIDPSLISDVFTVKVTDAYAICHLGYEEHLKDLLEHISQIKNLVSTGRQGLYLQIDMHDSMALGLNAAKFVVHENKDMFSWYKEKTEFLDWDR